MPLLGRLVPAPWVRWVVVGSDCFLLDLGADRYIALDAVAACIWPLATAGEEHSAVVERLIESGFGDRQTVDGLIDQFVAQALAGRLLLTAEDYADAVAIKRHSAPHRSLRLPLWVDAWRSIVATTLRLRRNHLYDCYADYMRCSLGPNRNTLDRLTHAFLFAENFWFRKRAPDDCLARSLALYRFLVANGSSVQHVIGIKIRPFAAHAWVEADGKVLMAASRGGYHPIARFSAPFAQ